jgi:DNA-binding CsgD family transcriptional regulator
VAGLTNKDPSAAAVELIDALSADVLQVLEAVQFPVGLIDLERRVRWQNAASLELLGDVPGKLDASIVAPADLARARDQFARKLLGAKHTEHEVSVVCRDGTHVRLETSSVPLRSADGVIGVLAMARVAKREAAAEIRPDLTQREQQTLTLLTAGCSTRQMAEVMGIAPETVRNHVKALCRRLGARSRVEAVAKGRRAGLV